MAQQAQLGPEDQEWEYKFVELSDGGLNLAARSDLIEDNQLTNALNVNLNRGFLESDSGYVTFQEQVLGNPRMTYRFRKTTGTIELLLITDTTVYKRASNEWQYISNATSTTLNGALSDGAVSATLTSATGFVAGSNIGITLDNGKQHKCIIGSVSGAVVTFGPALPSAAADGNAVVEALALTGNSSEQVVALTIASHDWVVFTNGVDIVKRYDGTDIIDVPNMPSGGDVICKSLGLLANHLILYNTIEGGTAWPQRARWADTADPAEWVTGNAGTQDLVDEPSPIKQALSLGPYIIVYKEESIIRHQYVGTVDTLFKFNTVIESEGSTSAYSAAKIGKSAHILFGRENIYNYNGGFNLVPIGDNMYDRLFGHDSEIDPGSLSLIQTKYVRELRQVWAFYNLATSAGYPNKLAKLDLVTGSWVEREFKDEVSGVGDFETTDNVQWSELVGPWYAQTFKWGSSRLISSSPTVMLCTPKVLGPVIILTTAELITDGDMPDNTNWTEGTGWLIGSGVASCDGTQVADSNLRQTLTALSDATLYEVVYTVTNYSAGGVQVVIGNDLDSAGPIYKANGTYTHQLLTVSAATTIDIRADSDFVGDVDDVSLKQLRGSRVMQYDYVSNTDNSFTINWTADGKDFHNPHHFIRTNMIEIYARGEFVNIYMSSDEGASWTLWGKITLDGQMTRYRLFKQVVVNRMRWRFQGNNAGFRMAWYGVEFRYESEQ